MKISIKCESGPGRGAAGGLHDFLGAGKGLGHDGGAVAAQAGGKPGPSGREALLLEGVVAFPTA